MQIDKIAPLPRVVAHIGAGRFSRDAHGPALQRLASGSDAKVILGGIADLDPTRPERAAVFANDFGYERCFEDWREMIEAVRPDLIVCTVQPNRTASVLKELLPLRIPVFTEKPPATTMEDMREITKLAVQHKVPTYVAFNRRRIPDIEFARQWIQENGPATYIRADMFRQRTLGPNACIETVIHLFDTLRFIANDVVGMHSYGRRADHGSFDYVIRLYFSDGVIGDVCAVGSWSTTRESYVVEAARGAKLDVTVCWPYSEISIWAGRRIFSANRLVHECSVSRDPLVATGILPQYELFLKTLVSGEASDCSLEGVYQSQLTAVAASIGFTGMLADAAHLMDSVP